MTISRWMRSILVVLAVVCGSALTVAASTQNVSRSYKADDTIVAGAAVSLRAGSSEGIELADTANGDRLLGVAVGAQNSLLAINEETNKAQVAITGNVAVLASTINGTIKTGDQLSVSPLSGMAMKAAPGERVLGLAQSSLDNSTPGSRQQSLTDKKGGQQTVTTGSVNLTISIGSDNKTGTEELNPLQRLGKALTGRAIPTYRIAIAVIVAITAVITVVVLLYATIHGAVISIGRNPLARNAILRSILPLFGMAAMVTLVSVLIITFLLN